MNIKELSDTNAIIHNLFSTRWSGDLSNSPIGDMRKQLYKNLKNQVDGYWSGHTAYHLMVDGGFLIDSKRVRIEGGMCAGKNLTELGKMFMRTMEVKAE